MTSKDFRSIRDLLKAFPSEQSCIDHLEKLRWNGNVISPFDPNSKVYNCKGNKYKCKNTGKYFNVKTATLFDHTKIELQTWFVAIYLITGHSKGISSVQLSKDLDVTQKTAWFILHRIRKCFGIDDEIQINNEVEVDETYIGGKNKNRPSNKRVENSTGGKSNDKTPVLGMIESFGNLRAITIDKTTIENIHPIIIKTIKKTSTIYSDEWIGHKSPGRIYNHSFVKHSASEYFINRVHTNTIEEFWSLLKRGIIGIYHFTSKKHLQNYIDVFVFRYNLKDCNIQLIFNKILSITEHRFTYKKLISNE